jgi:hypothetical protein
MNTPLPTNVSPLFKLYAILFGFKAISSILILLLYVGHYFTQMRPIKETQLNCSQINCSCSRYGNVDSTLFASHWPFSTNDTRAERSSFRLLCSIHSWKCVCATDVSHDQTVGRCCEQMGSPIAILWHCKTNLFQSLYLDSSVGGTKGV